MGSVTDVVEKGQKVKVKVLSFTGQKTSLSMKVITNWLLRISLVKISPFIPRGYYQLTLMYHGLSFLGFEQRTISYKMYVLESINFPDAFKVV